MQSLVTCKFGRVLVCIFMLVLSLVFTSCSNEKNKNDAVIKHLSIAKQMAEENKYEEAMQEWRMADHILPRDALVWGNMSMIEEQRGNHKAAIDAAYQAIKFSKDTEVPIYYYTIQLLLADNQISKAQNLTDQALKDARVLQDASEYSRALLCKGEILETNKDSEGALAIYKQALSIVPYLDISAKSTLTNHIKAIEAVH